MKLRTYRAAPVPRGGIAAALLLLGLVCGVYAQERTLEFDLNGDLRAVWDELRDPTNLPRFPRHETEGITYVTGSWHNQTWLVTTPSSPRDLTEFHWSEEGQMWRAGVLLVPFGEAQFPDHFLQDQGPGQVTPSLWTDVGAAWAGQVSANVSLDAFVLAGRERGAGLRTQWLGSYGTRADVSAFATAGTACWALDAGSWAGPLWLSGGIRGRAGSGADSTAVFHVRCPWTKNVWFHADWGLSATPPRLEAGAGATGTWGGLAVRLSAQQQREPVTNALSLAVSLTW